MSETFLPAAPAIRRIALASSPRAAALSGEWWMGIYLADNKVGYIHITAAPEKSGRERNVRFRSTTWTRIAILGHSLEQRIDADEMMDKELRPLRLNVRMGSGGGWIEIKARFQADRVEVERRAGDDITRKSLPIPKGANLAGDASTTLLQRRARVGQVWRFTFLNVVTLALEEATTRVLRRETVAMDGRSRKTVVIQTISPTVDITAWVTEDGQPVKMAMLPGLTLVRETREKAMSGLEERPYAPGRDLAMQTAVRTEGTVDAPGRARFLRVRIAGIPEERFVLSDGRQQARVEKSAQGISVEYTVDADVHPTLVSLSAEDRARLTASTAYLQASNPEIAARAREATAGAADDAARVEALWRWVHASMRAQGDIGLPRSALEVLREPVGVCRDYATLYAALARAAGIPTRVCAGIVYFQDRFYYHAWAESYAGGRWMPVDATVPPDFVDATHIKFAQGDATAMFGAVKIIGRLRAEILEQR